MRQHCADTTSSLTRTPINLRALLCKSSNRYSAACSALGPEMERRATTRAAGPAAKEIPMA